MKYQGRRARDDAVLSNLWRLAASSSGLVSLAEIKEWDKGPAHAEGCEGRGGNEAFVCPEDRCCTETIHSQVGQGELPLVQQLSGVEGRVALQWTWTLLCLEERKGKKQQSSSYFKTISELTAFPSIRELR